MTPLWLDILSAPVPVVIAATLWTCLGIVGIGYLAIDGWTRISFWQLRRRMRREAALRLAALRRL